jgi:ABC-2 type transport system permease protein
MVKNIFEIASITFKERIYYRFDLLLYIVNRIIEVLVYIFIWIAIYNNSNTENVFSIEQMITYYILVVSISSLVSWGVNEDIGLAIRNGQISRQLLNPISFFGYYFGIKLGDTLTSLICSVGTFVACSFIWSVLLPSSIVHFLLFALMIILGIVIVFFIDVIVGMVIFYTSSICGMQILRKSIISIFSGMVAPIFFFPNWFQKIVDILPFKEMVYTPINMYLGLIPINETVFIFIKQLVWIIILYFISKIFFHKAIKNITINGG